MIARNHQIKTKYFDGTRVRWYDVIIEEKLISMTLSYSLYYVMREVGKWAGLGRSSDEMLIINGDN